MAKSGTSDPVALLNRRMDRVEQILPTLATKEDLKLAIEPLATKEELRLAIERAVEPLATKEELRTLARDLREEIREEGGRSRRHMTVLIEHQDGKIQFLAEHILSLKSNRPEG